MNKGSVFIVSGPSGSGKDTILKNFFGLYPEVKLSISSITRPMRKNEVEGEKYHFITREEFVSLMENDMLLEFNEFCGNYYGSPKQPVLDCIEKGGDIILEVDVNGADKIRKKMPDAVSVFIMPPSYDVLYERLNGRGTEPEDVINKRMETALDEIRRAADYDYIVINDDLNEAVNDFAAIVRSSRLKIEKQKNLIDEVLR